jgi:hypothetical protein
VITAPWATRLDRRIEIIAHESSEKVDFYHQIFWITAHYTQIQKHFPQTNPYIFGMAFH